MVASSPARQRSARLNQRSFWCWARVSDKRPRAGRATFSTPRSSALRSFSAEKNPRSAVARVGACPNRSEEHTSELQSRVDLVCRLLLEKKKAAETRQRHKIGRVTNSLPPNPLYTLPSS